jgi:subtilisin family serine protease
LNTLRTLLSTLLVCLGASACAPLERQTKAPVDDNFADRQLLVMLRSAPPHFRPDITYAGGYDASVGRAARQRIAEGLATQYDLKIVNGWPMPALGVDCFVMEARNNASVARLVEQLSVDPRVESVQSMNLFHVLAYNDPLYPLQPSAKFWHLDEVHKLTTGRRVRVAVVDTGVEADHPDLTGRVALTRNFVDGPPDVAEVHGTAVAGIIAARANDGLGIAGVAPDSGLMALRACWQGAGNGATAICSSFTLAKSLQFALDEKAQILNLSIGGPRDRLLERLLDVALSRGVIVVSAFDPAVHNGGFPASHRGVLAVAGVDGHDASTAVLLGPGRDIPTSIPGQKWGFVSGSSFAAAHVTGLVALLRELAPNVRPQQIREALSPKVVSGVAGTHRAIVDACAAVARIGGACACSCAVAGDTKSPSPP